MGWETPRERRATPSRAAARRAALTPPPSPTSPPDDTHTQLLDLFLIYALASGGVQVRRAHPTRPASAGAPCASRSSPALTVGASTRPPPPPPSPPPPDTPDTPTHPPVRSLQFLYCLLGGKFPFNAFLASFLGHVSFFALTLALRQQLDPATAASEFPGLAPERAVADYVLANVLVLLAVWNYLG